eukprot:GHVR01166012.1.p1 GENE.GHVR01166012.1~~GHVR01166012.1.p1  ORF type:complete len:385 (+),score=61.08 GHVR01166012.1:68-1222(+)
MDQLHPESSRVSDSLKSFVLAVTPNVKSLRLVRCMNPACMRIVRLEDELLPLWICNAATRCCLQCNNTPCSCSKSASSTTGDHLRMTNRLDPPLTMSSGKSSVAIQSGIQSGIRNCEQQISTTDHEVSTIDFGTVQQPHEPQGNYEYHLPDLWKSFEKPSIYGVVVPFRPQISPSESSSEQTQTVTYIPYLSAVQLYDKSLTSASPVFEFFEREAPWRRRPFYLQLGALLEQQRQRRVSVGSRDVHNNDTQGSLGQCAGPSMSTQSDDSHEQTSSHTHTHTHTHSDTTKREGAEWLLVDSSEIGESSWFCVLWQPLQRNSTLQPEPPPFLVYHRFSVRSVLNEANEVMDASLLRFALLVCNADPRVCVFLFLWVSCTMITNTNV